MKTKTASYFRSNLVLRVKKSCLVVSVAGEAEPSKDRAWGCNHRKHDMGTRIIKCNKKLPVEQSWRNLRSCYKVAKVFDCVIYLIFILQLSASLFLLRLFLNQIICKPLHLNGQLLKFMGQTTAKA